MGSFVSLFAFRWAFFFFSVMVPFLLFPFSVWEGEVLWTGTNRWGFLLDFAAVTVAFLLSLSLSACA